MRALPGTLALALAVLTPVPGFAAEPIGHLVQRPCPAKATQNCVVKATLLGAPSSVQIVPFDGIFLDERVETEQVAFARFTIGSHPPLQGAVKLGPETKVIFRKWLVDEATGVREGELYVMVGHFLAFFTPRPKEKEKGTIWIETPTARIPLGGTMIEITVAPDDSTAVQVYEGTAEVKSKAGGAVELTAGTRTTVRVGEPPTPPSPIDPNENTLGPPTGTDFHPPGEPPVINPRDLLDLPRLDRP